MKISKLNLRNVVKIGVTCLAVVVMFVACGDKNNGNGNGDDSNGNGGGGGSVNGLTINNLPDRPGQSYDVKVFKTGTVFVTQQDWLKAVTNTGEFKNATLAFGSLSKNGSENTFSLVEWKGLIPDWSTKWTGTGNFPVILYDVNNDETTWWRIAQVQFTNGIGTANYSQFELLPW